MDETKKTEQTHVSEPKAPNPKPDSELFTPVPPSTHLGHLSVVMRDDISNMWKIAAEHLHHVDMPGFQPFMDPVDYIVKCTYEIWDQKGIGEIYRYYKHNALVHTSDGDTYGRDRVIENCLIKMAGYPDIRDYIDDVIWAPDGNGGFHTSMRWTWTAHNTGYSIYGPPTGKPVTVWGIANCYIKSNYIVEEWVTYNEISLIRPAQIRPPAPPWKRERTERWSV